MTQSPRRSNPRMPAADARRAPRTVLLAYDAPEDPGCQIPGLLRELGLDASPSTRLTEDFVRTAASEKPDLAVIRSDQPSAVTAAIVHALWEQALTPALIVSTCEDPDGLVRLLDTGAAVVITTEASINEVRCQTYAVWRLGQEMREKAERVEQLERNLANRRTVEQAKWKLVQERGMDEPEAHTRLQTAARNSRRPLIDIAQAVIDEAPLPAGAEI